MPSDLPLGLRVRDLTTDLHCGPDLDAIADRLNEEDDERSARNAERRQEQAEARREQKADR